MGNEEDDKKIYKILLLGDGASEKSGLVFRFVHGSYRSYYCINSHTIADTYQKDNFDVDGESVSIEILDTDMDMVRDIFPYYIPET